MESWRRLGPCTQEDKIKKREYTSTLLIDKLEKNKRMWPFLLEYSDGS